MPRGRIRGFIALARLAAAASLAMALVGGCLPSAPAASLGSPSVGPGPTFPPPLGVAETYALFADGETALAAGVEGTLAVTEAGDLLLPSGRLVANDVFFFGTAPFERLVPAGVHPVDLLEIEAESFGRRVAAARLRVGPGEPVDWEMALLPTDDPATLGPDEYFGFGVDSGTAAFASAEAAELVESRFEELGYADRVLAGLEPAGATGRTRRGSASTAAAARSSC